MTYLAEKIEDLAGWLEVWKKKILGRAIRDLLKQAEDGPRQGTDHFAYAGCYGHGETAFLRSGSSDAGVVEGCR